MNQKTLRSLLVAIFSANPDNLVTNIIVPKQGNWYNPQDQIANPDKPSTWIAYLMHGGKPRATPYYQQGGDDEEIGPPWATVSNISKVDLQFVGDKAEEYAQSVQFWLKRRDVCDLFSAQYAQLLADGLGEYFVSDFKQDGLNNVLAYNSSFSIQWVNLLESSQDQILTADVTGQVLVPEGV